MPLIRRCCATTVMCWQAGEKGVLLWRCCRHPASLQLSWSSVKLAFEQSAILKQMIAARTADALELTNGISIEVRPSSFRGLRGPTYIAVVADELSFWYADSSYANRTPKSWLRCVLVC